MKSKIERMQGMLACLAVLGIVASAAAAPAINSAVLNTRVFDDYPTSTLVAVDNYPALISFLDGPIGGTGQPFANRHNFRLSDNDISSAVFLNSDSFTFEADVTLLGDGPTEGGLQVSPWWSQNVDGAFNIRSTDGEIAAFGGRLPFYSFTASHGITYAAGTTVHQKIIYNANSLTMADPATIEYIYTDASGTYSSGPLAFDEGNPNEDPPYGLWGMLNDARVGGYVQIFNIPQIEHQGGIRFENMVFTPEPASLALLALGALALRRRTA